MKQTILEEDAKYLLINHQWKGYEDFKVLFMDSNLNFKSGRYNSLNGFSQSSIEDVKKSNFIIDWSK